MGRPPVIPLEKQAEIVDEYFSAGLSLKAFAEKKGIKKAEIHYLVKKYYRSSALLSDDDSSSLTGKDTPPSQTDSEKMEICKLRRDAWKPPRHALWLVEGIDDGDNVPYQSPNFFHRYTMSY
jgi:hypothetical protein